MRRTIIPYKPHLKELAKKLRQNSTLAEVLLWDQLKNKQLLGLDFDRQKSLDQYIVDFYCKNLQLAIEVDGDSHDYAFAEDMLRQQRLESLGVRFLRFTDEEVKQDMNNVLRTIESWVEENGQQ
ncbi:endonuclease domain-containing protein [Rufibacter immobilis]|uniref:endonuclease domain-containing protein n=1 Tax=Rufibacter immobilis TaxID=1348778 RepID=UPI0035EB1C64